MSLISLLKTLHQEERFKSISQLSSEQQKTLLNQLQNIDPQTFFQQQKLLKTASTLDPFSPFDSVSRPDKRAAETGRKLLAEGKVGCLMVAGGQGTRLGFNGPKGAYPITPVRHKTLFQYFEERRQAASAQAGQHLRMAIMTSPQNHEQTKTAFASQAELFTQSTLPFLNEEGNLFFDSTGNVAFGPDGNGSSIQAFFTSGIAEKWEKAGIELITFIMVDNPLADPYDAELIGAHSQSHVDVTIKCIERSSLEEKVGVVVKQGDKTTVREYSEMPPEAWYDKDSHGHLVYNIANISLFCFSFSFLKKIWNHPLPLHKAFKKVGHQELHAWKFERFIFDLLPLASSATALLYPRENCFAPLKDKERIKAVQEALTHFDRTTLANITGSIPPPICQEIDPAFYYPTKELLAKWKGRKIPPLAYVEA